MNSSLYLKFLVAFVLTVYKYHLPAECVYCYVCNANYQACADPPDLNAIRYNMEPCNGQCVVYINPWTGLLTRSCSNYLGISGTGVETINGVTYSFCQYDGCNSGGAPSLVATTIASQTTIAGGVTTIAGGATTIAGGMTSVLPTLTTSAIAGCSRGCVNMGTQNKDCSCSCLALYSGPYCEIVNCDPASQYPFCATDFTTQDCVQEAPYILCPKLCNPDCLTRASTTTTVATKPTTTAAPTTMTGCNLQCQSAAVLNTTTCTCKCLPGTSGTLCEIIDCKQPDTNWCGAVSCTDDPSIKFYCIQKCNTCSTTVPPVLTTTAAPTTAALTTAAPTMAASTTTAQKCPGLTCYSASTLDETTCTCKCLSAATYGTNCQFIDCSVQDPLFCSYSTCSASPTIPFQCTHLCGLCPGGVQTTAAPTMAPTMAPTIAPTMAPTMAPTTKASGACVPIDCKFGGNFDLNTCACNCLDNFFGTDCSIVSVAADWTDPIECNDPLMSCGAGLTLDQDIAGMCPLKCLFCGRKVCNNGGFLKTDCTCQCLPAYSSDPTCSIKNCADNQGCGTQFPKSACGYPEIVAMCPTMCKATGC